MVGMNGRNELLGKAVRAAGWGYAGTALKLAIQLGVQILLARLLGPSEYGIFAIGVIVVAFALYFGDVASSALIPRPEPNTIELRFAFTWQLIVSLLITFVIFNIANPIAQFVNEPRSAGVLKTLSFVCVLNALGGVSLAILRRRLDYKRIQIAQISGYFIGYVLIALPWAIWETPSVSALVAAWLTQVGVTSLLFYFFAPHPVYPKLKCTSGVELLLFGWHSLVSNIGTWALTNLDRVIVARYFPVHQVGFYTTASNLLSTPLSQIYATFQSVVFSATSRLEDNKDEQGKILSTLIILAILVVGLGYGFTFATATSLIAVLYGDQWSDCAPFIRIFSIALFFNALSGIISPLLWASGAIKKDARIQLVMLILLATTAAYAAQSSVHSVALAVAAISILRTLLFVKISSRHFNIKIIRLLSSTAPIALYILTVTFFASVLTQFLETSHYTNLSTMLFSMLFYIAALIGALAFRKILGTDFENATSPILRKIISISTGKKMHLK